LSKVSLETLRITFKRRKKIYTMKFITKLTFSTFQSTRKAMSTLETKIPRAKAKRVKITSLNFINEFLYFSLLSTLS